MKYGCALATLTLTFAACGDNFRPPDPIDETPATATITVARSGAASGSISAQAVSIACGTTCTAVVPVGTKVTLTATADTGAVLAGWTGGGCSGGAASCEVTVDADVTVTQRFDVAMFTVDLSLLGGGTGIVSSTPSGMSCPGTCTIQVPYNTIVGLQASAAALSSFMGWGGACTGSDECSFTVTANTAVMAAFASNHDLIVMPAGTGSGTVTSSAGGISCPGTCSHDYTPDTVVTLTAVTNADSTFDGWSGGGCSGTDPCQVTLSAATMVTATFTLVQHDLTVVPAGAGTGTVTSVPLGISCGTTCTGSYDAHTVITLAAVADSDSTFAGWSGGGCTGTGPCVVTLEDATAVTATFDLQSFTLTVATSGSGVGSVDSSPAGITCGATCSAAFVATTVVTLTPTAAVGSAFTGWTGACTGRGACQVTISQAASVTASFDVHGTLYTIADASDKLQAVDPITYAVTDIGSLGISYSFGDCAWNPTNSTMYMTDGRGAKALYTVNLATGAATQVGVHGITDMFSLAYHPPTDALYGIAGNGNLYKFDASTGAATVVGPTGKSNINGLVWDSTRSQFVAMTAGAIAFYSVDVSTGALTALKTGLPFVDNNGMTYDPVLDVFWVMDYQGGVIQYDPNNDYARTNLASGKGAHTCMAYLPAVLP